MWIKKLISHTIDQLYYKKLEDKKLIRYKEGKIVSTKGERFTQVTKEERLEIKRTIVNILA